MDLTPILNNFLSAPILFFFLGVLAVLAKSDLDIPQPLPKFFSLYLLIAIGFKGGVELHKEFSAHGLSSTILLALGAAILLACIVPVYTFFLLRLKQDVYNAGAIAATYGSISAVTFITATSFLDSSKIEYSGFMVAAMALMESPAVIIGVLLVRMFAPKDPAANGHSLASSWGELLRDALFNQSVFLLVGAMIIGGITGHRGEADLAPFTGALFKGFLAFFLLDLGLVAARRLSDLTRAGPFLIGFAILIPIVNGMAGLAVAALLALSPGDALLLAILSGSASYIAVPAAMRLAVPQANPGLYVPMALAVTFPFNIIVGIPGYMFLINLLWKTGA